MSALVSQDQLIGTIYEASVFPDRWPGVLQAIAGSVGARGGNLIRSTHGIIEVFPSPEVAQISEDFHREGWNERNTRVSRLLARASHAGFLADSDLHSDAEIATLPMYTQFLTPRGGAAGAATVIQGAKDDAQIIAIEGFESHAASRAATSILDCLRPHIARASVLAEQIRATHLANLVEGFNTMGAAIGLLDHSGKLIAATKPFDSNLDELFVDTPRRMRLINPESDHRFKAALIDLNHVRRGISIAVRNKEGLGAAVLHLLPARHDARDLFSRATIFAILAAPGNRQLPAADIICALFDLTPAEARIARGIAEGLSPAQIAQKLNVSVETVRTQLKKVYFKTSTNRQSDLCLLIAQLMA